MPLIDNRLGAGHPGREEMEGHPEKGGHGPFAAGVVLRQLAGSA